MRLWFFCILLGTSFSLIGRATEGGRFKAPIQYFGRFDFSDPQGPRFSWSGSAIKARFSGSMAQVNFKSFAVDSDIYLIAFLDGQKLRRFKISKAQTQSVLLTKDLAFGVHELLIVRDTEAYYGDLQFLGFEFGEGAQLLTPLPFANPMRLEVIGDSITAGYGDLATNCSWSVETESAVAAYSFKLTQKLQAQPGTSIAISGRGIYRNYSGGPGNDSMPAMPFYYSKTLMNDVDLSWEFQFQASDQPNVVLVNLGTNDLNGEGSSLRDPLSESYLNLVKLIRAKYPEAKIIIATSPMLKGLKSLWQKMVIKQAIDKLKSDGDRQIFYFEFEALIGPTGCDAHPSETQQSQMAEKLSKFIHGLGY